MIISKIVISNEAPSINGALWAKPVPGGFTLFALINGSWKPFKAAEEEKPIQTKPDKVNTVKAVKKEIVGNSKDTKEDMTLYGLKAYINDVLDNLG